jgi:hypothetical protein
MVKYAKATKQVDQIVPHLKHIPLWLEQWQADTAQQRELYLHVYELLDEAKSKEAHGAPPSCCHGPRRLDARPVVVRHLGDDVLCAFGTMP